MTRLQSLSLFVLALSFGAATASASPFAQDSADALVRQGRELLAAGRAHEAQAAFERAVELEAAPEVRFWQVRGWIAQERFPEAMAGADELRAEGMASADCDYLLGLAFLGAAKQAIAESGGGAFTQDQLGDAYALLTRATTADGLRFSDAWLPRAEAGWYAQELEGANEAIERALELAPGDPQAHALRGRIAFSRFSAAAGDADAQEVCWQEALDSFGRAVELYGEPSDAPDRTALAEAHLQRGHLFAWKQDAQAAGAEYALAMGWDPSRVDFTQVRSTLGEAFGDSVADGARRFRERYGEREPVFATLSWWDGYARFERGDWTGSERAFRSAVELWPAYTNSWFYLFRLGYSQGDYAAAVDALQRYAETDWDGLVAMLRSSGADQVRVIDYLVGWCANPDEHEGRALNEQAAMLCDLLTGVQPEVSRHWNNLGLFVRDRGDVLRWTARRAEGEGADPATLSALWDRAFEAYARALELEPGNPNYVNDYAVMLHYYLQRDFDEAQQLYARAEALAAARLEAPGLSEAEREVVQTALRDARDNQRRLAQFLEREAAGEELDPNLVR
jgi:tetratricopeptide (TPR) repeat protein